MAPLEDNISPPAHVPEDLLRPRGKPPGPKTSQFITGAEDYRGLEEMERPHSSYGEKREKTEERDHSNAENDPRDPGNHGSRWHHLTRVRRADPPRSTPDPEPGQSHAKDTGNGAGQRFPVGDHDPRETVPGEGTRRPGRWDRRVIGTIQDPCDRYEAVKLQYTAGTKMVFTFDLCRVEALQAEDSHGAPPGARY
ncbi:unnamed protein product [Lota lota]